MDAYPTRLGCIAQIMIASFIETPALGTKM